MGAGPGRVVVVRHYRHAHHHGARFGIVRVEVGKIGEVHGRAVLYGLKSARCVEVTDRLGGSFGLLLSGRTLRLFDCSSEGTGLGKLIGVDASNELSLCQR